MSCKKIISFTLFLLLLPVAVFAQEDKTVTLTVSAQGQTISEAKQNALRDAIEQAFGTFISSNTEILNDDLVKDEIVSVSNGNIQDYEVISELELPNGSYATTLIATVSVTKLTSFVESKGVSVEFKGGLFAANIMQQELNEKAELKAVENIVKASYEILKNSFDYFVETKGSPTLNNEKYDIQLRVSIKLNENFYQFRRFFINSLSGLTMNQSEINNYEEIKKPIGQLIIRKDTINFQENFIRKGEYGSYLKKSFDENSEKIVYLDVLYNKHPRIPHARGDMAELRVSEVTSQKELKDKFVPTLFKGARSLPEVMYKVKKNDLGYAKIFFRNPSSMTLLNRYFQIALYWMLNFEISNNVDSIIGFDILEKDRNSVKNRFFFTILNHFNRPGFPEIYSKNCRSSECRESMEHFFDWSSNFYTNEKFLTNLYSISYATRDKASLYTNSAAAYFPNLLSILPIKITPKIMLASFSNFKAGDEIASIEYTDIKTLEEIKQISEYTVKRIIKD
jgi:hypothetical protein